MHVIVIINSSHFLASLQRQFVLHPTRSTSLYFILFYRICFGKTICVTPSAPVHDLQRGVLYEINQLNKPRQGIIEMEVDIHLPLISFPCCFAKHDICSTIHNNRRSAAALIYFLPTYTLDEQKGRDALYADLRRVALVGVDCIMLWGRECGKNQVMHIRR
jgi:hypothetical protein